MLTWQRITTVLLAAAIIAGAIYFGRVVSRPEGGMPKVPWVKYVHPNVKALKDAKALRTAGRLHEARDLCVRALLTAPLSPVTLELRDMLGSINTELFFQQEPSPRKEIYTVNRGDALASIARKLRSSTDAIMRINQLDSTLIRPGDQLLVPRLDFTITIDLPRERIVLHDGHGFFTQYPIAAADLPPTRATRLETKVRAKTFLADGQPVARGSDPAQSATPWIFLQRSGYVLYGVDEKGGVTESEIAIEENATDEKTSAAEDPNRPPQGIAMLKEHIAELELLIRRGTPVTVILERD